MHAYTIRTMTRPDLDLALSWAKQEGWRPGVYDADHFYQTDPDGFFMGFIGDQPIGCISGVKYGDDYGFIGLYIVRPEWRGQGYGLQLWQTAMTTLQGRNIGLDGVIAQQPNYQKSGFRIAYRHVRYQGCHNRPASSDADIVAADSVSFETLLAYDRRYFAADRSVFLQSWLKQQQGAALVLRTADGVMGYGVIRACDGGYRIGPLFAERQSVAERLLDALLAQIPPGSDFFIDIPEPNRHAVDLVNARNLQAVFETARMYTRQDPVANLDTVYAITSLELG